MKAVSLIALGAFAPFLLAADGMPSGDVEAGEAYFTQNCMMCHSVAPDAKDGMGPNLRGLGGSASGTGEFRFTTALKNAHITWSEQTLDGFLAAPSEEVPGTMMITSIDDPQKRADVVAYLLSLR